MAAPLDRPASRGRIGLIVLIGVVGFLAGIAGGLAATALVFPFPAIVSGGVMTRVRANSQTASSFPSLLPISASVVDIFSIDRDEDDPVLLPLHQRTGRGVALTSDGWVVTHARALPNTVRSRPVVVTQERRIRPVDRIAYDPISDLVFLHVETLNATVLPFHERNGLRIGDALFAPTPDGGAVTLTLRALAAQRNPGSIRSSDRWDAAISVAGGATLPVGTAIVDSSGALVGVSIDDANVLPIGVVTSALPSLFSKDVITRNVLGIRYRDASEYGHGGNRMREGVELTAEGRQAAIGSKSPLGGILSAGDAILAVGDDPITARRLLPELLQEYPLGATVPLRVLRGGKEEIVNVALNTVVGDALVVAAADAGGVDVPHSSE